FERQGLMMRGWIRLPEFVDVEENLGWIILDVSQPSTPIAKLPRDAVFLTSGSGTIRWTVKYYAPRELPPPIKVELAYPPRQIASGALLCVLGIAIPLAISLRIRSIALRSHPDDREGNWFGYWRFLNGMATSVLLVWFLVFAVLKLDGIARWA